ncbi:MAG: hypothetical protein B7Z66_04365 [Chromatiales bacterium 21-64-14]|nr:MAG: hypothetical protein B7Z66_04365 [Chromatiales bacterium 21-64-14]HQU14687.1 regulatory protein RecX [Gammaproteobacteria bacterium]
MKRPKSKKPDAQAPEAPQARRVALDLLARREHSTSELRRKLRARGVEDTDAEEALQRLSHERLQSDARYAEVYAESRATRGYGPVRIAAELRERGVAPELIARCVEPDGAQWAARARDARCKRFGAVIPRDLKERARQVRFLQYRGFTHEQIHCVLKADAQVADDLRQ